jgi:uncharacterized protein involved in exopolysaccharide biosynthesis
VRDLEPADEGGRLEPLGHLEPAYEYQRTLRDYLGALRRRFWVALAVGVLILAAGLTAALTLPPVYRSQGTILIEQQLIPQDLVRTTVTSFATERIQVIGQRVMTTSNLLEVIDKYGVYAQDRQDTPTEVLVERMRSHIDVRMISANVTNQRTGQAGAATIAFTVGFENERPDLAQQVANELVTLYLNENLKTRTQLAMETTTFLADEVERLADEVSRLERELAEFKKRNEGQLPDQQSLNRDAYERTEGAIQASTRQLESLQQSRQVVLKRLAALDPFESGGRTNQTVLSTSERLRQLRNTYVSLRAQYQYGHPDLMRIKRELESVIREVQAERDPADLRLALVQTEEELAEAQAHPEADEAEVTRLAATAEALERQIQALANIDLSAVEGVPGATNPAYLQLQAQLAAIELEMKTEREREQALRAKLTEYEERLSKAPEIEREFRQLVRDYQNAITNYRDMKAKETEARLAQSLENERKGERFTLIEPPLQPGKPVSPNRPAIAGLALVLAVGGALGISLLLELLDGRVRGARRVAAILGEAPLSVIPPIVLPEDRRRRRRRVVLVAAGATTGMLVAGVTAVHFLYSPLDILWFRLLRVAGLMA